MGKLKLFAYGVAAVLVLAIVFAFVPARVPRPQVSDTQSDQDHGAYLVHAAGCISCHENPDNPGVLSGGLSLASPFGTFYVPNITPDIETGIGTWTSTDLVRAIKHGLGPDGNMYFPAFPYRAYRGMSDEDAQAIAAWILAQPAASAVVPAHELTIPLWLGQKLMPGWNRLADLLEPELPVASDPQMQRGSYLARNLGHCGECHTPRNRLGIPDLSREFHGAPVVDGEAAAITPEALEGWSEEDFAFFLFLGLKPDGEYVGGEMEPVIEHNTSPLTEEDRLALAAFFLRRQQP